MDLKIEKIFFPSTGVELVLDLSSLHPVILPSIIYDADFNNQTFIIARPVQPMGHDTQFKEMHITTLIRINGIKQRVGLKCIPAGSSNKYKLAKGKEIRVIKLKYVPPVNETNIRLGYRLSLNNRFTARAEIIDNEKIFYSAQDFTIRDLSLSGMGILIPRKLGNKVNPLTKKEIHHRAKIKITLIKRESLKPVNELTTDFEIKRIGMNFNDLNVLAGLLFIRLGSANEEALSHFIHQAQIDELKKFNEV